MRASVALGFDFGKIRIGVAVGQSITGTARPLKTIGCDNYRPDWEAIGGLIRTWHPTHLVVGLPLTMDGAQQEISDAARRFARQLAGRYGLPVHLVDERLSSAEARTFLREAGRRDEQVDPVAAKLILESWLAEQESP